MQFSFAEKCTVYFISVNYTGQIKLVTLLQPDGETEHRGLLPDCAGSLWWGLTTAFSDHAIGSCTGVTVGVAKRPPYKNHRRVVGIRVKHFIYFGIRRGYRHADCLLYVPVSYAEMLTHFSNPSTPLVIGAV